MTTTTDEAALVRAVCESPADDAPRLVYADWCEERTGDVPCGRCRGHKRVMVPDAGALQRMRQRGGTPMIPPQRHIPCPACSGSGRVSDGRRERAEFIRVQVELATVDQRTVAHSEPWASLRHRERELLAAHGTAWVLPPPSVSGCRVLNLCGSDRSVPANWLGVEFRRGFVESVTCTLAGWCGGPCGRCGVDVVGHLYRLNCPDCRGAGRTPALGPKVVACQPVTDVRLTERRPQDYHNNDATFHEGRLYGWSRTPPGNDGEEVDLPEPLWAAVAKQPGCEVHGPWADFHSEAAALAALSRACVNWARARAGLPPLDSPAKAQP